MTAPAPLDLSALLDDLERAHAAGGLREQIARWICEQRNGADGWDHEPGRRYWLEDADDLLSGPLAFVPTLIAELRKRDAALRAVEELADELGGPPTVAEHGALRRALADRLRACIAAALSPESVQS